MAAARIDPVAISAARSHVGCVRQINEDRLLDRPEQGLWVVADGMGGHRAGDVAATAVIDALATLPDAPEATMVGEALAAANRVIWNASARVGGMSGSTVAGLALVDDAALVFWIGDSRVYRWRDGALEQLTRDHSLVQEMVDAGVLTPEQARAHPRANVVTRALGVDPEAEPDMLTVPVEPGDRFLLCSDGLSGMVAPAELAQAMALPVAGAVDSLIAAAMAGGGRDNVTVVVVQP